MFIESLIIVVASYAAGYIWDRISFWRQKRRYLEENQEYVDQLEEFDSAYHPEQPDLDVAEKSKEYLSEVFPNGVEERTKGMSNEEILELFRSIEKSAEEIMGVDVSDVDFYTTEEVPTCNYCGYYVHDGNSLHVNAAYIFSGRPELIEEQVYTIFHELKHARQWKAILGEADYGYSDEQLRSWAENFQHYIPCAVSDELYRKQPVELDAFGFESLIRKKQQ